MGGKTDYLTKWAGAELILAAGTAWAWLENPVGTAETDLFSSGAVVLALGVPPGLAVAAFSARFGSREGAAGGAFWLAAFVFALWLCGVTAAAGFMGPLWFCDPGPGGCETNVTTRAVAVGAGLAAIGTCAWAEKRLLRRWGPSCASHTRC